MAKTIAVVGALDTKGKEFAFVKDQIEQRGHKALMINTGVVEDPPYQPDITAAVIAEAGGSSLEALRQRHDRGEAMDVMARGVGLVTRQLFDEGRFDAILGMGGSAGTTIGAAAMRSLPLGVPKVLVSTVASGNTAPYVGQKDVVMIPSIVDVAGVNRISAGVYARAVGAAIGMVETPEPKIEQKPLLAASMFGNTTHIVGRCAAEMEKNGYEVLVFHATGTGGRTMEGLIDEGFIEGVLDITTTEWADELCGGVFSAGPTRLDAAAKHSLPQVIVPGCLDMANFGGPETIPDKYNGRNFYHWNPSVTLMRTNVDENRRLGEILAQKANQSEGPVAFLLPKGGVSMLDKEGEQFWDPEADAALFDAIRQNVNKDIEVIEMEENINDDAFCDAVSMKMLELLKQAKK